MSQGGAPRRVVLVPAYATIDPVCERGLRALEDRGWVVRRSFGDAAIDAARSQLATDALADGFDVLAWIDGDIRFDPDDLETLCAHELPFVAAIYPKKGLRELACHVLPGTEEITCGAGGGLLEVRYVGFGFVVTRRALYDAMQASTLLDLPVCNTHFGRPLVPWFMPAVVETGNGGWYLREDYAFCERVRVAGVPILVDTRVRLRHVGPHGYSWEEAGAPERRYATFRYVLKGPTVPTTSPTT